MITWLSRGFIFADLVNIFIILSLDQIEVISQAKNCRLFFLESFRELFVPQRFVMTSCPKNKTAKVTITDTQCDNL